VIVTVDDGFAARLYQLLWRAEPTAREAAYLAECVERFVLLGAPSPSVEPGPPIWSSLATPRARVTERLLEGLVSLVAVAPSQTLALRLFDRAERVADRCREWCGEVGLMGLTESQIALN